MAWDHDDVQSPSDAAQREGEFETALDLEEARRKAEELARQERERDTAAQPPDTRNTPKK
jgi:hypothetical protein